MSENQKYLDEVRKKLAPKTAERLTEILSPEKPARPLNAIQEYVLGRIDMALSTEGPRPSADELAASIEKDLKGER